MTDITAAEPVGRFEPGSPEWHTARAGSITASRIAAVLGLSPWESRFSLWHRMAGQATEQVQNDLMHWGVLLEPVILGEYARLHNVNLNAQPGTWRNRQRPWQVATPDALAPLVEAKYSPLGNGFGEPGSDEIPVYYRAQVLWQLDTLGGPEHGYDRGDLAVFVGTTGYAEYTVEYSRDECEYMRAEARAFLDTLDRNERPDVDAHSATYAVLRELHPDIDDERVDVPGSIALPYLDALDAYNAAENEKRLATVKLAEFMGRARRAYFDGAQIAMRVPGQGDNPPFVRPATRKTTGQKVSTS